MDSELKEAFNVAMDSFPWESKEQREGYLALVQFKMRFGLLPILPIDYDAVFFIQKDVESNEYWRDAVAQQVSELQNVIADSQESLARALSRVDQLELTVRALMQSIESLTQGKKQIKIYE